MFHIESNMIGWETCMLWKMATYLSTGTTYFYNIENGELQWDPLSISVNVGLAVEYKCTIDIQSDEEA